MLECREDTSNITYEDCERLTAPLRMSSRVKLVFRLLFPLVLIWPWPGLPAQTDEKSEITPLEFKALFLAKIPPYIQWPDKDKDGDIVIGILGNDAPFASLVQQL